jgi:uncharacterized protein YecT (DUF1311 family)
MRFPLIAAALLLCGQAFAQLPPKKPNCNALSGAEAIECMDKYGDCSTPEWLSPPARAECAANAIKQSASAAKVDRAAIDKKLNPDRRKALRTADAAFEAFAVADCEFDASEFAGGSLYSAQYDACMVHWADERADHYARIRKGVEAAAKR